MRMRPKSAANVMRIENGCPESGAYYRSITGEGKFSATVVLCAFSIACCRIGLFQAGLVHMET
jgi:uncharacterized membrane protein YedE/YeeE